MEVDTINKVSRTNCSKYRPKKKKKKKLPTQTARRDRTYVIPLS